MAQSCLAWIYAHPLGVSAGIGILTACAIVLFVGFALARKAG